MLCAQHASSAVGASGNPPARSQTNSMHGLLFVLGLVAPAPKPSTVDVDPIIGRLLRSSSYARHPSTTITDLIATSTGLSIWRRALTSGRVPDFDGVDQSAPWPPQPLCGQLSEAMSKLGLPRTTVRHPSLVPAALAAVLAATARFGEEIDRRADAAASATDDRDEDEDEEYSYVYDDEVNEADDSVAVPEDEEEALLQAARQIAEAFSSEWQPALRGVRTVEALGGNDGGDAGVLTAAAGMTFSPNDGLWAHTGWESLETVQRQLRQLEELSSLIGSLGQRASPNGVPERGPAVVFDSRAAPSAALSELSPRELSGLARTSNLARVAPSELALLAGTRGHAADDDVVVVDDDMRRDERDGMEIVEGTGGKGSERGEVSARMGGARRRLFLSRLAEKQLLGYSLEGWSESLGRPKPRRLSRLPRARGGPLVVCLDTSHSMAGGRETLAKAVVLETVRTAYAQGRPCLLFAFSGTSDLAELRLAPPRRSRAARRRRSSRGSRGEGGGISDRAGLTRLLDFLGCSFGGGTDVAGPLRRALDVLEQPAEDDVIYSGADLLLVSDGELPSPPLDDATFARLRDLQRTQGFMVHGLIVGKPRATPLDEMCDVVHTCLSKFDPYVLPVSQPPSPPIPDASSNASPNIALTPTCPDHSALRQAGNHAREDG